MSDDRNAGSGELWVRHTGEVSPGELAGWTVALSSAELARAERFRSAEDRRDYIAAHALVRAALSREASLMPADWTLLPDPRGKPAVPASQAGTPPLSFSLSHTRGLVACAVTRGGQIGVDAERLDRGTDARAIADRFFSAKEAAMLRQCPDSDRSCRFVELWTLKEAWLKGEGGGLSLGLDTCTFSLDGPSGIHLSSGQIGWHFLLLASQSPAGRVALACRQATTARLRLTVHVEGRPAAVAVQPLRWTDDVDVRLVSDAGGR
jgi:4'-phosphopantetheinyl transferase